MNTTFMGLASLNDQVVHSAALASCFFCKNGDAPSHKSVPKSITHLTESSGRVSKRKRIGGRMVSTSPRRATIVNTSVIVKGG